MIKIFSSPRARKYASEKNIELDKVNGSGPNGRIIEEDVIYYIDRSPEPNELASKESKITALAKKISQVENIDYNNIVGTGIDGKIMSKDVFSHLEEQVLKVTAVRKKPLAGMRKIIAEKMSQSKRNAPHVTLTVKVDVTNLVKYKNNTNPEQKITYTDLLVKIISHSMEIYQNMNVSLNDGEIIYSKQINIGVAVALKEGLVVPNIKNTGEKTLSEISSEIKEKVRMAKSGKLTSNDMNGGSITISNLGMYEVDGFTPVINLPESSILGVGRIIEDMIVENQQVRIGKTMMLSLSFDHRIIDGAPAAEFLGEIKRLIENPLLILGEVEH